MRWTKQGSRFKTEKEFRTEDRERAAMEGVADRLCLVLRRTPVYFSRESGRLNGTADHLTIDKSGANKRALECFNKKLQAEIEICRSKYKNNMVEQDHRTIKRRGKMAPVPRPESSVTRKDGGH